mmetsp:Transcript_13632/g.29279  ORF Transcript_13632/g.29279 Transcript_13632/m.29279 type:complete len:225 (+) Transcript_13632:382-1056(+)
MRILYTSGSSAARLLTPSLSSNPSSVRILHTSHIDDRCNSDSLSTNLANASDATSFFHWRSRPAISNSLARCDAALMELARQCVSQSTWMRLRKRREREWRSWASSTVFPSRKRGREGTFSRRLSQTRSFSVRVKVLMQLLWWDSWRSSWAVIFLMSLCGSLVLLTICLTNTDSVPLVVECVALAALPLKHVACATIALPPGAAAHLANSNNASNPPAATNGPT